MASQRSLGDCAPLSNGSRRAQRPQHRRHRAGHGAGHVRTATQRHGIANSPMVEEHNHSAADAADQAGGANAALQNQYAHSTQPSTNARDPAERSVLSPHSNSTRPSDHSRSLFSSLSSSSYATPPPSIPHPPTLPAGALATPPIRFINGPRLAPSHLSKRPYNAYRGRDPIKKLVQNPKLRAILADKPVPKPRKKVAGDRVELRMGVKG